MRIHLRKRDTGETWMNRKGVYSEADGFHHTFNKQKTEDGYMDVPEESRIDGYLPVEIRPEYDARVQRLQKVADTEEAPNPEWSDEPHPDYPDLKQYITRWEVVNLSEEAVAQALVDAKDEHLYGQYPQKEQDKHFKHYIMMMDGLMPADENYKNFMIAMGVWTDQLSGQVKERIAAYEADGTVPDFDNWLPRPYVDLDDYKAKNP